MTHTRRNFLKTAGAAGVVALAGNVSPTAAKTPDRAGKAAARSGPQKLPKQMTFCTLRKNGEYSLGLKTSRGILDVKKAAQALHKTVPLTIDEVLQGADTQGLKALLDQALANGGLKSAFIEEAQAEFGPCVTNPEKIMMLGYNYKKHVIEVKQQMPTSPVLLNKYNNALNCHNGVIDLPEVAKKFDYEVELVVVMGKVARNVSEADALSYVFGYCVGNDFSARDLQFKTSQLMLGKTSDGFGPIGPYLVTADQVPDPQNLNLDCRVNGEVRQSSNTNDMIFSCANIISYVSQIWTLKPGDIFFTGTPSGVINGMPPEKQVWLKAGDKIACSIEKLGELRFGLANPKQAKAT
jgi:2-keto-4-pentenoate hydratase/2-oxohepta-3-ene-1,7-dioic acid hydratase in catechol pathway